VYRNRRHAGLLLLRKLGKYRNREDVVVLSIPRGGVVVGDIISKKLNLAHDLVITKKIGTPSQEELAMGSIDQEGNVLLDRDLISDLGITTSQIDRQIKKAKAKVKKYRSEFSKSFDLKGKTIILVDDGIATGLTIKQAIEYLRLQKVKRIVIVSPVSPKDTYFKLKKLADEIVVLQTPPNFRAVGQYYKSFPQVTNREVIQLLKD